MSIQLRSSRKTNGDIVLSIPAEDVLRFLLGSRYTSIHGIPQNEKEWKHILGRLLKVLNKSIDINISTDAIHKAQIARYIRILKSSIDSPENTDPEVILALVGLCFELMGGSLDHRSRKVINDNPSNFCTDSMRSVSYSQDFGQKYRTIIQSSFYDEFKKYYSTGQLEENFRGKFREFIEWFKKQYPAAYAQLF